MAVISSRHLHDLRWCALAASLPAGARQARLGAFASGRRSSARQTGAGTWFMRWSQSPEDGAVPLCVKRLGDDAAVLARSSGEERGRGVEPRHRAGGASMASDEAWVDGKPVIQHQLARIDYSCSNLASAHRQVRARLFREASVSPFSRGPSGFLPLATRRRFGDAPRPPPRPPRRRQRCCQNVRERQEPRRPDKMSS